MGGRSAQGRWNKPGDPSLCERSDCNAARASEAHAVSDRPHRLYWTLPATLTTSYTLLINIFRSGSQSICSRQSSTSRHTARPVCLRCRAVCISSCVGACVRACCLQAPGSDSSPPPDGHAATPCYMAHSSTGAFASASGDTQVARMRTSGHVMNEEFSFSLPL